MGYKYDKNELKQNLDIDSVASLVSDFGGEPILKGDHFVAKTICHNDFGEGSHKLYYYENTQLFKCYTNCDVLDIFELVIKVKEIQEGVKWSLPRAMEYVASFFGIAGTKTSETDNLEDWKILNNYEHLAAVEPTKKKREIKIYDSSILKFFPRPRVLPWEREGILPEIMAKRNIAYNPSTGGILIPHYDINGNLIGIRERTLIKDNEARGKYLPSIIKNQSYSHPLGFNLYGLDQSKENISAMKTAIIAEAEKSVLLYESYFGLENSLICASCGGSLSIHQVQLLLDLGVSEIIIAFDKDFQDSQDPNREKVIKKLTNIDKKYGAYVQVSFLFDKGELLGYKDSPLDKGPQVFQELYKNRIIL